MAFSNTSPGLRWQHARQVDRRAIQSLGHGSYAVPSSRASARYTVPITFDPQGQFVTAACARPDFLQEPEPVWGTPLLHGPRGCKHILTAGLKAKEQPI